MQGNPLSTFLIFIVMEALSRMLSAVIGGGFMSDFLFGDKNWGRLNNSNLLLFANDALVFSDVDHNQICSLRGSILMF